MEQGGVILSGLLRTAAWLTLFSVLVFDTGAVLINRVLLDEAARIAAGAAADAFGVSRDPATADAAARRSLADQAGVELVSVELAGEGIVVTVRRQARVLLAGRVPPLRGLVTAEVSASAGLTGLRGNR